MKLSPHVTIYRFPMAAISSITNRLTGLALSGLFVGTGISYLLPDCPIQFSEYAVIRDPILFSISYHTFGGIRHFIWDKYPSVLDKRLVHKSSILLFIASIGTTAILEQNYQKYFKTNIKRVEQEPKI